MPGRPQLVQMAHVYELVCALRTGLVAWTHRHSPAQSHSGHAHLSAPQGGRSQQWRSV